MRNLIITFIFGVLVAGPGSASGLRSDMVDFAIAQVNAWVLTDEVFEAVRTQNVRTGALSSEEVSLMDDVWRSEVGRPETPLISRVVDAPVSAYILDQVVALQGKIQEVVIMDARGLNVAASSTTTDYWQGDEPKYTETYLKGPGAVFVDDVTFDESTQSFLGQVSVSLVDPETGEAIGAVTIGLNAEEFF